MAGKRPAPAGRKSPARALLRGPPTASASIRACAAAPCAPPTRVGGAGLRVSPPRIANRPPGAADPGKPLRQARADITALARSFEFYAGACDKVHGETLPYLDGYTVLTLREPYGVTGHIIPWNYPAQIFGRSVGAALAMGNACVVKPAEDASLSTLMVGQLALDVGFPPGALNIVPGYCDEAGAALAGHADIDHISFTGSPEVGTLEQIAACEHHRPVTLELGGKSPQLVFADADQAAALPFIVGGVVQNAGQTCSAGSPVLVQEQIYDRFVDAVASKVNSLCVRASG